jgi:hypothetical protein
VNAHTEAVSRFIGDSGWQDGPHYLQNRIPRKTKNIIKLSDIKKARREYIPWRLLY